MVGDRGGHIEAGEETMGGKKQLDDALSVKAQARYPRRWFAVGVDEADV